MYFEDEEKEPRKAALKKLMDVMGSASADKMRKMKDPNKRMTEHETPEEGHEEAEGFEGGKMPGQDRKMSMMDDDDGDEISEDQKRMITELYHKHCR